MAGVRRAGSTSGVPRKPVATRPSPRTSSRERGADPPVARLRGDRPNWRATAQPVWVVIGVIRQRAQVTPRSRRRAPAPRLRCVARGAPRRRPSSARCARRTRSRGTVESAFASQWRDRGRPGRASRRTARAADRTIGPAAARERREPRRMLGELAPRARRRRTTRTPPTARSSPRPPSPPGRTGLAVEDDVGDHRRDAEHVVLVQREVAEPARPRRPRSRRAWMPSARTPGRRRSSRGARRAAGSRSARTRSCPAATRPRSRGAGSGRDPTHANEDRGGVSLLIATTSRRAPRPRSRPRRSGSRGT